LDISCCTEAPVSALKTETGLVIIDPNMTNDTNPAFNIVTIPLFIKRLLH